MVILSASVKKFSVSPVRDFQFCLFNVCLLLLTKTMRYTRYGIFLFCGQQQPVMSEYKKNGHEEIFEYIWMPYYVPNKYPNIFGSHIFTKQLSEYICTPEIARIRIQIIFEGNFIQIFEYSYSSLIEEIFEKGLVMLPLNKIIYWMFVMHKLYLDLLFS